MDDGGFIITGLSHHHGGVLGDFTEGVWTPKNIFAVPASELTRDDLLCWSPAWTAINFVVQFGTKTQVSTARYGMLTVPAGLMVLAYRKDGI